jgi:hypothetical protein
MKELLALADRWERLADEREELALTARDPSYQAQWAGEFLCYRSCAADLRALVEGTGNLCEHCTPGRSCAVCGRAA